MAEPPKPAKQRQQRELRLVSEWVTTHFPNDRAIFQIRVGQINPELSRPDITNAERMVIGNFRRQADAVVIRDSEVLVVEGYVLPELGKVSQLLTYLQLVPNTPELVGFVDKPIRGMLLGAVEDPILTQMARRFGLGVTIYKPPWVEDFLLTLAARHRRTRKTA